MIVKRRFASFGGMGGIWQRIKNGFSRTDAIIQGKMNKTASPTEIPKEEENGEKKKDSVQSDGKVKKSYGFPETKQPQSIIERLKLFKKAEEKEKVKEFQKTNVVYWKKGNFFRGSTLKTAMLTRQIMKLPLDAAILQMQFSPKKAANHVLKVLIDLRNSIQANTNGFYVKEATVGRGTYLKRIDMKGRGRFGIQRRGHVQVRIAVWKPDQKMLVQKLLKIKKIPREDRPILRKLDYY